MVFVIREALINLGARDVRQAAIDNGVHSFPVLEMADDVVDPDASALDDGVTTTHIRQECDVAVTDTCIVSVPSCKNTSSQLLKRGFDSGDSGDSGGLLFAFPICV